MQVLSTRARKDVKVADIKVQVCLFAFDCLYLDGAELLQRPLTERRAALYSAVNEAPGELLFATAKVAPRQQIAEDMTPRVCICLCSTWRSFRCRVLAMAPGRE